MKNSTFLNLDQFEQWRSQLEEEIEYFASFFPPETHEKLDFSPNSLNIVTAWLLEKYATPEATLDDEDSKLLDGALAYIGETYRKNLGGHWNIHFEKFEPNYRYGEQPVVEGFYQNMAVCPYFNILDAIQEQYEGYLRENLKGLLEMVKRSRSNDV